MYPQLYCPLAQQLFLIFLCNKKQLPLRWLPVVASSGCIASFRCCYALVFRLRSNMIRSRKFCHTLGTPLRRMNGGAMSYASATENRSEKGNDSDIDDSTSSLSSNDDQVLYESPFGSLVTRLRAVSLTTGLCGTLGLPLVASLQSQSPIENTGFLALSSLFLLGTWGSTAAVHFIFSPYVYQVTRSNVRNDDHFKFHYKTLFLRKSEVVANAGGQIGPYEGMRPLCNVLVKGTPFYIHPEFLYDSMLRSAMKLDEKAVNRENKQRSKDVF